MSASVVVVIDVFVAADVDSSVEEITVDIGEATVVVVILLVDEVLFTSECPFAKTNIVIAFLFE